MQLLVEIAAVQGRISSAKNEPLEVLDVRETETGDRRLICLPVEMEKQLRAKIRRMFGFEQMAGTLLLLEFDNESRVVSADPIRSLVDAVILHVEREEARQSAES